MTSLVAGMLVGALTVPGTHRAEAAKGGVSAKPPPVFVGAKGEYVRAAQGTFCFFGDRGGLCADYLYPLQVKADLPVVAGQRLAIDAGVRVRRLSASLVRVTCDAAGCDGIDDLGTLKVWRTGKGRHWRVKLPPELNGANVLSVSVRFRRGGDSNVWAGLASAEAQTPRIPSGRASKSTG